MLKRILLLISAILVIFTGCKKPIKVYSEADSLIELIATREPDLINDLAAYTAMSTKNGRFWDTVYPEVKGIPDTFYNTKIYYLWMDNIQALYQSFKAGKVDKKDFDYYYQAWKADTIECTSDYLKTFIVVAAGNGKSGQRYYLFDSNNNYNLSDEIPYETSLIPLNSFGNNNKEYQPHRVIYQKYSKSNIQNDSTWISFFESPDMMWIQLCEKASAKFQFDSISYKITVRPSISGHYSFDPKFNISSAYNKRSKNHNVGEYVRLGNTYYQIGCSKDGLKITLNKDENAFNNGSTQIGMPPLNFTANTIKGETINFPSDYKGKYILLDFWALSCGPCIEEIRNYYIDIYKKYGGKKFEIIGVADNSLEDLSEFINNNGINWTIIPDEGLKVVQKKYHVSHYPTLYLISPDGLIIATENELRAGKFISILEENI